MTFLERSELKGKPQSPESVIVFQKAIAVAIVNPDNHVLLMKRVDYGKGHGQDWVYPGGVVEEGESFDAAARREVLEEAGIVLEEGKNMLFPLLTILLRRMQ